MEKEEVLIELNKYTKLVGKFIKKDKIDFVSFLDYETEVDNYTKKLAHDIIKDYIKLFNEILSDFNNEEYSKEVYNLLVNRIKFEHNILKENNKLDYKYLIIYSKILKITT